MDAHIGQVMIHEDGSQSLLVHYAYSDDVFARKNSEKIACAPNLKELEAQPRRQWPWQRSNDVRAVTCPQCQRTEVFLAASTATYREPPPSVVHLLARKIALGPWLVACVAGVLGGQRSEDPRAVTCPMCIATPEFDAAVAELAAMPRKRAIS